MTCSAVEHVSERIVEVSCYCSLLVSHTQHEDVPYVQRASWLDDAFAFYIHMIRSIATAYIEGVFSYRILTPAINIGYCAAHCWQLLRSKAGAETRTVLNRETLTDYGRALCTHVKEYTIPQYGDYPYDQFVLLTAHDCMIQIKRYTERNLREVIGGIERQINDMLKIGHYGAHAYKLLTNYHGEAEKKYITGI